MDDLLGLFGLGRAITLTVATGASVAAFLTAPIDAKSASGPAQAETRSALPTDATGGEICRAAGATCHGIAGTSSSAAMPARLSPRRTGVTAPPR
jgi:hypothetical protein